MKWQGPDAEQEAVVWKALTLLAYLFIFSVGVGILWGLLHFLKMLQDILLPLGVAVILAYLLHPLVSLLHRWGMQRSRAVLLLFALSLSLLGGAVLLLGPKIYQEGAILAQTAPQSISNLWARIDHFLTSNGQQPLGDLSQHLTAAMGQGMSLGWAGLGTLAHTLGLMIGIVFIPFYLFYLLADQPQIERSWRDYIPLHDSALRRELVVIVEQINKYLVSFFRGQILVAAIDGLLLAIGLSIIGVSSSLLIGAAAAILTIIPYFGIMITCLATLLVAGYQENGGTHLVFLSLAVFAVVQTLENTLISPRIMNHRTGLHPLTVILSILIWSSLLGGLLGAILAVPLTATLKVLLTRYALIRKPEPA